MIICKRCALCKLAFTLNFGYDVNLLPSMFIVWIQLMYFKLGWKLYKNFFVSEKPFNLI